MTAELLQLNTSRLALKLFLSIFYQYVANISAHSERQEPQ